MLETENYFDTKDGTPVTGTFRSLQKTLDCGVYSHLKDTRLKN